MSWFPVWLLACVMFPQLSLPEVTAVLTGCGTLSGIGICRFRSKHGKMHPVCAAAAVLLCAGSGFLILHRFGTLFPAVVLPAVSLFSALRASGKTTEELFSPTGFGTFMTGTAILAICFGIASLPFDIVTTAGVCAVITVCFLFLRNQTMLHKMVNRRSSTEQEIPQDIRRSNLRLIVILLVILSLLFLFREPIWQLLGVLRDVLLAVFLFLARNIRKFFSWLSSDPVDEPQDAFEEGGDMPYAEGNNWLINLLIILPTALIAVYVWKQFLSDWVETVRDAMIAWIMRLRARKAGMHHSGSADGAFIDTESSVLPDRPKKRQRKQWRRKLRAWQKMPDQPEKFYAGYRLILDAPAWTEKPDCAETAREICRKWHSQVPEFPLDSPTAALEFDRYAMEGLPDHALSELHDALLKIAQLR